jgi:hypothetical protein
MPEPEIDLYTLFNSVTKTLKEEQDHLNEADTYNHDHGDNMVNNFKAITKALKQEKDASPSDQLSFASQTLLKSSSSASAKLYSEGLSRAANQFRGQSTLNPTDAISLIQALMGGAQISQHAGSTTQGQPSDMMGNLLGALLGGGQTSHSGTESTESQTTDMLGGLMGALLGGGGADSQAAQPEQAQSADVLGEIMGTFLGSDKPNPPSQTGSSNKNVGGIDVNDLLGMGLAYLQANQQGKSPMEAIIQAIMAGGQMNESPHHSQSGQLVTSTMLNTIVSILGRQNQ